MFLSVNFAVLVRESCSDPLEIVAERDLLAFLGQIDLAIDRLEIEPERFLLFALEDFQNFCLLVYFLLVDADQHQSLLLLLVGNNGEAVDGSISIEILLKIYSDLLLIPVLENHDEIPLLNDFVRFPGKHLLYPFLILPPQS